MEHVVHDFVDAYNGGVSVSGCTCLLPEIHA